MASPAVRVEPAQLSAPAGGATPTPPARRRFLPPGWALGALLVGYPVWWALGLGPFSWPILALPMGAWLIAQRRLSLPRGFPIWLVFCGWVLASGVQVDTPEHMAGFVLRASYYVSAGVFFLYLVNTRTRIATPVIEARG